MLESDNRYLQLILDSTPDGITVQGPDGDLLYANLAAAKLIGFDSPQELLETPVSEVVARFELYDAQGNPFPSTRLPGREALQGREPEEAVIRFRRVSDGVVNWSIVGARPVFDESGELLFVVNTFRYITDYMRALEAERESRRRAEEAEQRLSFLARCSEILAESLDYGVTLRRVSQLAVPDIADWCAVDLCIDSLERVSVAHVDPAKVELAYEMQRRYPPREDDAAGLYKVLRTGEPEIYPEVTDDMLARGTFDEGQLQLLRQLNLRSVIIVPLKVQDRVLGAITLVGAESGRRFKEKDVALATELAQRAALAVENARLYDEAQRLNQQLEQRVTQRTRALQEANQQLQQKVEAIQEAEQRFRALLESAPDAMIIVAPDGAIRLVNSQAETIFDYERSELLGRSVEMLIPSSFHDIHVAHRKAYAQQPRTRPMGAGLYLLGRRKDGSEFPVEISLSPLQSEGETLFIAAVRDVSERRRAEARLQRSEMQLAEAQAIANLGSWEWDISQGTVSWSKTMLRIFDLEGTAPTSRDVLSRVHPADRRRVMNALRAAQDRGIPFSLHHRILLEGTDAKGHSVRTMLAQGTVETDDDGNVVRIVGTSQDVTMQKEIEEELRRSEALYRAMADNLPNESVLVVDQDLRYRLARGPGLHVNDLSGWEGKIVWDVADEAWRERAVSRYQKAFSGEVTTEEVQRDGYTYFVQTVPLTNDAGDAYAALTLVQDVTRQREAEETTQRLLELSRNLNATLDISTLLETIEESAVKLTKADSGQLTADRRRQTAEGDDTQMLRKPVVNLNGETLGYLEVTRKGEAVPFSDTDQEKLDGLAQIAAIALQNALSFEHLRELGQKLVSAQEAERRSLSRELHDSTGQVLMALTMSISMLSEQVRGQEPSSVPFDRNEFLEQLEEIGEMVESVYEEIRAVSHALRPPSLDVANVDEALSGLCEDYARHSGLQIEYTGCEPPDLPDNISISLYRLLQEALTNVTKHAGAERVEVSLNDGENQIELSVRDDGVGFAVTEILERKGQGGVGLVGLHERFELLGGALHIESSPGSGTRISGVFSLESVR